MIVSLRLVVPWSIRIEDPFIIIDPWSSIEWISVCRHCQRPYCCDDGQRLPPSTTLTELAITTVEADPQRNLLSRRDWGL